MTTPSIPTSLRRWLSILTLFINLAAAPLLARDGAQGDERQPFFSRLRISVSNSEGGVGTDADQMTQLAEAEEMLQRAEDLRERLSMLESQAAEMNDMMLYKCLRGQSRRANQLVKLATRSYSKLLTAISEEDEHTVEVVVELLSFLPAQLDKLDLDKDMCAGTVPGVLIEYSR